MDIREIEIRDLDVPDIGTYLNNVPLPIPPVVPVTQYIGAPIVDIPGCVEANKDDSKSKTIGVDDPDSTVILCDGTVPSYNPIDYKPEEMIITKPAPVPKVPTPKSPEAPTPEIPVIPPSTAIVEEKTEPEIPWQEKYLPAPEAATTTAAIAVIATTSALMAKPLADILLKAIKPTVKKVMKKIAKIRGKEPEVLSVGDRRAEQRQMNTAVKELRSVFPRRKKKRKG